MGRVQRAISAVLLPFIWLVEVYSTVKVGCFGPAKVIPVTLVGAARGYITVGSVGALVAIVDVRHDATV